MAEAARCLALLERDLGHAEALVLEARARATNAGFETVAIRTLSGCFASIRAHGMRRRTCSRSHAKCRCGKETGSANSGHSSISSCSNWSETGRMLRERPPVNWLNWRRSFAKAARLLFARCLTALAAEASGEDARKELNEGLESLRMADAKHRLAYALLRATHGDFRRGDIERARARSEEALKLAHMLERPSETAMAHVALLRCALASGDAKDIEHQRNALRRAGKTQIAAHVRRQAEELLIPDEDSRRGAAAERSRGRK